MNGSKNYKARIRSAWSAYNGGPSKICRWANPKDAWAKNDAAFYSQLTNQRWKNYVEDQDRDSQVDIGCLMENETNCSPVPSPAPGSTLVENQLYIVSDGRACLFSEGVAHCLPQQKDRLCLQGVDDFDAEDPLSTSASNINRLNPKLWDRHQLCHFWEASLKKVGDAIVTLKNINLRSSPGSGILAVIPAGSALTVIDFEVRNQETLERYYKVRYRSSSGYIFAGDKTDHQEWATAARPNTVTDPLIAQANQRVRIEAPSGINLRATPGGRLLTTVPFKSVLTIQQIVIRDVDNEVYYRVHFRGTEGFIYSGQLLPKETVLDWTSVLP